MKFQHEADERELSTERHIRKQFEDACEAENMWIKQIVQQRITEKEKTFAEARTYLNFKIQVLLEGAETLGKTHEIETELQERPIPIQGTDVEMSNEVLKENSRPIGCANEKLKITNTSNDLDIEASTKH